mmetsp:Transcript_10343/g.31643  ORF Transcript_10343/g.31643 Transcript_10343/m.31643 type:complete len:460 (+) Transcript_10343:302-1681(+)|eukprot:CAMPEP_0198734344 /NCGR_PEP_ID=MMETSP1475-20131203/51964_1 /TAXON_ID= ORGANISM="Unidentified sp., Strain CCMP1999" /NCGR_SAMPLE_ID=MMETSP1475 /ASSEMBLY_ACC=CAM_ASM_001111 /LENGTH=459 /DNA_ID=CAMNT_0044497797 /DNA_START=255 /DNA_END=1634 /DNA_ORIENTATION=+
MTVVCVPDVVLRHPPPEVFDGLIWTERNLFKRQIEYLALEDTILKCARSQTDPTHDIYDLLDCTCQRGKKPGQILLLNKKGKRIFSFIVQDSEVDAWLRKLKYACTWGLEKHYTLGQVIGKGGFGNVYRATNNAREEVAVKVIEVDRLPPRDRKFIGKEMEILPLLNHPNIVKTHDIFIDQKKRKISIAMEMLSGGDLLDFIIANGPLREKEAKAVMEQLFSVLRYLHGADLAHRDLKPENILLRGDGKDLKIAVTDFGFADKVTPDGIVVVQKDLQFSGGTIGYMAPEVALSRVQTTAVDMWACGVILYILLSGRKPFVGSNEAILSKSLVGDFVFHKDSFYGVSDDAKSLVRSLLHVQPHVRLTAQSVVHHKWFAASPYPANEMGYCTPTGRLRRAVHAIIFVRSWLGKCTTRTKGKHKMTSSSTGRHYVQILKASVSADRTLSPMDIAFRNTAEAE